jgi:hypothetical protein
LVFGESDNDRRAVRELILALRPELDRRVQLRERPLVLIKGVTPAKLRTRVSALRRTVQADSVRSEVAAVVIHEDCDELEPAHERVSKEISDALSEEDYGVVPATPAFEIEAWWFLWPRALGAYRESWRAPEEYRGRQVGRISNAKEELRRAVRPRRLAGSEARKFVSYEENDSPGIAAVVRRLGCVRDAEATSDSFAAFCSLVDAMRISMR